MQHNQIAETYGEVLPESVSKLLRAINVTAEDIFFDLGSGLGKVVKQVFTDTNVKEAHGIEINATLHEQAMRDSVTLPDRILTFKQGDFLTTPITGATIVLIASPCFGPSILHALGRKINETPTIHTVMSLRPIATLTRVTFKKVVRVECSWDTALCYIYQA